MMTMMAPVGFVHSEKKTTEKKEKTQRVIGYMYVYSSPDLLATPAAAAMKRHLQTTYRGPSFTGTLTHT
jgi:hypothetical protein